MPFRPSLTIGFVALLAAAIVAQRAESGHEVPVYPSYYPHEIALEAVPADRAEGLLAAGKIHAYAGAEPPFAGGVPPQVRSVETLGRIVTLRVNPDIAFSGDGAGRCSLIEAGIRGLAVQKGFVPHPYPVTPLNGDYLSYVDLAEAAKARLLGAAGQRPEPALRVRAEGPAAGLVPPEWLARGTDWNLVVELADPAQIEIRDATSINGWLGPPWLKSGWHLADRLLADGIENAEAAGHAGDLRERLQSGDYADAVERINLERELVDLLGASCRKRVVGYAVKRLYYSAEFTEGVENIGFDSIDGFGSAMFIRTVKLKDFPWNGWLSLGVESPPNAAWNPIAGFTDAFGRLLWAAVGDPALLPQPYDAGWMLNRAADVQSGFGR